jgi:hypothetical protein
MSNDKLPALPPRPKPRTDWEPYEHWVAETYMDAQDTRIAELEREIRELKQKGQSLCQKLGEGLVDKAEENMQAMRLERNAERKNGQ